MVETETNAGNAENDQSKNRRPDQSITDLEAAKLLLDAWKFRQSHAWSILTRYFFAAVFVSAIPYLLKPEVAERLSEIMIVFPVLGGLLALSAVWLYAAEYIRAQSMNTGFRKLLEKYGHYKLMPLRKFEKYVLKPKIGWTTVYILVVASLLISIANFLIVRDFYGS